MTSPRTPRPILAVVLVLLGLGALLQAMPWGFYAFSVWTQTPFDGGIATQAFSELGLLLHKFALVGLLLVALLGDGSGAPGRVRAAASFALLAILASWPAPLHLPEAGPMPPLEQWGRLALQAAAYAVLVWPSWRLGAAATLGVILPQAAVALSSVIFTSYRNGGDYPYGLMGASFALHALGFLVLTVVFASALWDAMGSGLRARAAPAAEPATGP